MIIVGILSNLHLYLMVRLLCVGVH